MGSGKLRDLIIHALRLQADFIVVDQNLTPAQAGNIAEATDIKVIDRSQLILDLFARRARTREGKIQVELAQLKYLLPRLMTRGDSGLSRWRAGSAGADPASRSWRSIAGACATGSARSSAARSRAAAPRAAPLAPPRARRPGRLAGRLHQRGQEHAPEPAD